MQLAYDLAEGRKEESKKRRQYVTEELHVPPAESEIVFVQWPRSARVNVLNPIAPFLRFRCRPHQYKPLNNVADRTARSGTMKTPGIGFAAALRSRTWRGIVLRSYVMIMRSSAAASSRSAGSLMPRRPAVFMSRTSI